jgi:hypothetical protein
MPVDAATGAEGGGPAQQPDARVLPLPVSSARCKTCRSPQRLSAEIMIVRGLGYSEVVRRLGDAPGLSAKTLREHCVRGHRAVETEVVRRLIEAIEGGRTAVLEMGVGQAVKQLVEAQATVEACDRLLAAGLLRPTLAAGLRASKMLMHWDELVMADTLHMRRLEEADRAVTVILGIAREHMAPRAWSAFLRAVDGSADLRPYCSPPLAV